MATVNQPFFIAMLLELAGIGFLVIGWLTLKSDAKSRMRQLYMATCLCLMLWSSAYGYMTIAVHTGTTRLLWAIGFAACCMMFPFWLHFLLHIADVPLPRRPLWILPFYAVAAVLAAMSVAFGNVAFVDTAWGNQFIYSGGWLRAALLFITFEIVAFCALQIYWVRAPKPRRQRRQALVFMVLTLIVAPIGMLLDFVLPGFLAMSAPPLATLPMFIMALMLFRTVRVNRGLTATVEEAAVIVFQDVRVPALLLDAGNTVIIANEASLAFWGKPKGMAGADALQLLKVNGEAPGRALFEADLVDQKVEVETPQGTRICELQLIIQRDRHQDVFYKMAVFLDVTVLLNALDQAHTSSQAKGEFLSHMSHEIRTPLNAVTGMLQIARKSLGKDDKPKAMDSITGAIEASHHLLGIINDVLDMSKIEAGKYEITCEPFALTTALAEVVSIATQRCREKNLTFWHNLALVPDVWVCGDKLRIKQILINVLGNAVKFTRSGGTVSMAVEAGEHGGAMDLCFTLADNGVGMSEDFLTRVFDPFEQADTSGHSGGTGLGMPISKMLAGLMGGDLTAQSTLGEGSTFVFSLTLAVADAQPLAQADRAGGYDFSGKRVLLVEDVEINRLILRELLGDTHVAIDEAGDGAGALEMYAASCAQYYDLILMDIQMPRMDGYEATRAIRALKRPDAGTVPIVAMTANAYREDVDKALAAGMNCHLAKPVDMDVALATLAAYLSVAGTA